MRNCRNFFSLLKNVYNCQTSHFKYQYSKLRKVLKEVSIGDMEADESIESVQEANLLSKLDNPFILKYHDSFLDGEYFCIVTEYCEVRSNKRINLLLLNNL
jgi:hypothetical protein